MYNLELPKAIVKLQNLNKVEQPQEKAREETIERNKKRGLNQTRSQV